MPQYHKILTAIFLTILLNSCSSLKNIANKILHKDQLTQKETITTVPKKTVPAQQPYTTSPPPSNEKALPANPKPTPVAVKAIADIKIMREFRAAWIASVANIDWPSKPGLSAYEQKAEAIDLLDFLKKNQFNAVILQVRPQADALYKSDIEPWSYYLTGEQGVAPEPYYDPLSFWIDEAHKRGLELHAWLNPYRAHGTNEKTLSDRSVVRTNPERVLKLKEGYWWLDPSLKETQDQTSAVVMDIVKRYDVDGIHFDDYFYPYPSYHGGKDFPDDVSWNKYLQSGGLLNRGDWRRNAVNTLIERLYKEIKSEKKYVKFGLSPFGIYRPGYPSTVTGFDQYDKLYADAKLWLNKGWIDYMAPQLYWPINKVGQKFPDLLGWWQSENTMQRHLWPGINVVNSKPSVASNQEVVNEINLTRDMVPKSAGTIHWNLSSLVKNTNLAKELLDGPYKNEALIPASPWLDGIAPNAPDVLFSKNNSDIQIKWISKDTETFKWVLYFQYDNQWSYKICSLNETSRILNQKIIDAQGKELTLKNVVVTAVDRSGNESMQLITRID